MKSTRIIYVGVIAFLIPSMAQTSVLVAQQPDVPGASAQFSQQELDQLLAPIALYPDSLLSQILMASTYPLEVVQADRWVRQNSKLQGDALTDALEKQSWDPSVKSLANFPQVLSMMSEKLDWITKLGDAFISQQKQVMDTTQALRAKAKSQGNLETTPQQTVTVQQVDQSPSPVIVIESPSPQVVYVPTYNPTVVYGAWPYPAYPPYYYRPPGYVAGVAAVSFGAGVACGAAWGYAWGHCNWGHGNVNVNFNQNNFNTRINRSNYSQNNLYRGGNNTWQHDAAHRGGAAYRDAGAAGRYGGASAADAARARDTYRGRADAGRQDLARGGADQIRGGQSPSAGTRDIQNRSGAGNRPQTADRPGTGAPDRGSQGNRPQTADRSASPSHSRPSQTSRPAQTQRSGGAFDGVGSGSQARSESQRGQASRSSSAGRSAGSGGGSSFRGASGGGSRGGMGRGGGRGGGGRGGGRR
ncbi:MAG: DUF3300 domain-containing protein [Planctomycetes bacterium]|nr:DUF3300 domain-containing protein [Planctomycetota bacterium]MBI3835400.1 DUF3300 domain-containing protein [Planctomycetota bacterium]